MEFEASKESNPINSIDANSDDFYNQTKDGIGLNLSRLTKDIEMMKQHRITAAENEVKTAALFHANLFQSVEKLKSLNKENEVNEKSLTPIEYVHMSEDHNKDIVSPQ